ncbi:3'(2'),5'-bisphosphate nucleotidase CysQ [Desulfurobacterium atlanticum]|uniref:3'(2'),5'-bisphosphate nucleotidase CysQ n=1 Tax=Desulfurobacterium atlanticum TaxID=240169 RepID=A0A239AB04_9BACT|nr:3'(2'),5'-bisphosphate nucleotidase CysQ [Desulfurobacterium atlanticum]SNR92204.1 3'(2'),5'-bisphosphate nucleotidase [Desulfurobacterium atlanticum]
MRELLFVAITTALKAGDAIMKIYERDFTVEEKADNSPLTEADRVSHKIIVTHLHDFPVLSEEGKEIPYEERKNWEKLWIVDPLDGTKEFIKRNGEFTVNIAFVEKGVPVLGVVYAPAIGVLYYGGQGFGAFKVENGDFSFLEDITSSEVFWRELSKVAVSLPVIDDRKEIVVVASRSHRNPETEEFIRQIEKKYGKVKTISQGSSLKLTAVAEGKADVYPRIAPTMEWDTAAGQAVVEAAGGKVVEYETGNLLRYNKENLLNPYFVAFRKGFFV